MVVLKLNVKLNLLDTSILKYLSLMKNARSSLTIENAGLFSMVTLKERLKNVIIA